jgi:predicted PurR-regulated permease PerM
LANGGLQLKLYIRNIAIGLLLLILILFIVIVVLHWKKLFSVLRVVFYAITFAYVMVPISEWLERFMPRITAILLLFGALLLILSLVLLLIVPSFIRQISSLKEHIPQFASDLKSYTREIQLGLYDMGLPYGIQQVMEESIENIQKRMLDSTRKIIERVMDGTASIPQLLMVPVLSFYFLRDRKYFKKIISGIIPLKYRKSTLRTFSEIHYILNRFIRSQLITSLIIGIFTTIGFLVIRLPYALVLGIISGVFEIIPYFGPWLGAIPAVIITILYAPTKIIWTILVVIVVQQLEGSFITPKIMGDHVGLHPVYIILSLLIGGMFFGVIGMLFAVPVVLIIRVILKNLYLSIVTVTN